MKTRITELLGTRYPIVEGGMQWVGRAELAAAVSNAGALGMVTARTQPNPQALREEIARCQALTDAPFGVNLTLTMLGAAVPYDDWIAAIVDSGMDVVDAIAKLRCDYNDRPMNPPCMQTVTAETFGVEYPEPQKA